MRPIRPWAVKRNMEFSPVAGELRRAPRANARDGNAQRMRDREDAQGSPSRLVLPLRVCDRMRRSRTMSGGSAWRLRAPWRKTSVFDSRFQAAIKEAGDVERAGPARAGSRAC